MRYIQESPKFWRGIIIAAILCFTFSNSSFSESSKPPDPNTKAGIPIHTQEGGAPGPAGLSFPSHYGLLRTGKIDATFGSKGVFGTGLDPYWGEDPEDPRATFDMPAGSGIYYLFGGALWIGGVVGTDTLVSVGADGWQNVNDIYPDGYTSTSHPGSVMPISPVGDEAYRADYTDSLHQGIPIFQDFLAHRPHKPLPIKIATRAHIWRTPPADHCILYDVVITNIGTQTIQDGCAALYMDGDVGDISNPTNASIDDLTGSLPDSGVAYIIDNDGDFSYAKHPLGAICARLLSFSWQANILGYNWWIGNGDPTADFGPMMIANYRNFQTGGTGTPEGDANKYFMMRRGEWDYDQAFTTYNDSAQGWRPISAYLAPVFSKGYDTRFLLSMGLFSLPPDSSVRFVFSIFGADSIHSNSSNGRNLGLNGGTYNPILYKANLNLANIYRSGTVAESLAQFLLNPATPVYGLKVTKSFVDSVTVEWDDWVFPTIDGYNIYLTQVPDTAFPYLGTIPPWYQPQAPTPLTQVGTQHRYTLTGLDPKLAYVANVAHRYGAQVGTLGSGTGIRLKVEPAAPVALDTLTFFKGGAGSLIRWHEPAGTLVHHFNIYKFDSTWALKKFKPYYTTSRQNYDYTMLLNRNGQNWFYYALPVYKTVPAPESTYLDMHAVDGDRYAIMAVDSQGYMSDYSDVSVTRESTRSKDVLVLYNSSPSSNYVFIDSIRAFYDRILAPYSHDLYSWYDSVSAHGCTITGATCLDWHDFMRYRLVILDDGLFDGVMSSSFEDVRHGYATYLASGGSLAYFGTFSHLGGAQHSLITTPAFYYRSNPLLTEFFGIDSAFDVGALYYKLHSSAPYVDSLFGFYHGEAVSPALADIYVDSTHERITNAIRAYWPKSTPPSVATFHLTGAGQTIFNYRSLHPTSSVNEGQPVGVMTATPTGTSYLYGFHLWSLDSSSAQGLVDWMVASAPPAPLPAQEIPDSPDQFFVQNYPNPFNPNTTIAFTLPAKAYVTVDIFNLLGQRVRSLGDIEMGAGSHSLIWDGNDASGRAVASGIYLYRLTAGANIACRKMVLLK